MSKLKPSKTIWMGDLDIWMDENFIRQCWYHSTGDHVSVKLIRDKLTGQSAGYAFVDFGTIEAAATALTFSGTVMPGTIDRLYKLNVASGGVSGIFSGVHQTGPEYSVFVGDLGPEVTDVMLLELFQTRFTSIRSAKVVTDVNTGISKGYGFVRFGDEREQQQSMLEMKGQVCGSRPIRISMATPKNRLGFVQNTPPATPLMADAKQYSTIPPGIDYASNPGFIPLASYPPYPYTFDQTNTTVFVGGLDPQVTEAELGKHFLPFGDISYVKVPAGMRCGFVSFRYRSSAEMAIQQMAGHKIGNSQIRLSWGNSPYPSYPYPIYNMPPPGYGDYATIPYTDQEYLPQEGDDHQGVEQEEEFSYPPDNTDEESVPKFKTL
ncbi:hypothetical protein BC833DRAFT_586317 [Globomyces pollinis-pini]|nr:hypothetical protein BC833DRAFT_586317 [Globomyces pollinis-pini]